jgi:hypothetical protein
MPRVRHLRLVRLPVGARDVRLPSTLPNVGYGELWEYVLDTAKPVFTDRPLVTPGAETPVGGRRLAVSRRVD